MGERGEEGGERETYFHMCSHLPPLQMCQVKILIFLHLQTHGGGWGWGGGGAHSSRYPQFSNLSLLGVETLSLSVVLTFPCMENKDCLKDMCVWLEYPANYPGNSCGTLVPHSCYSIYQPHGSLQPYVKLLGLLFGTAHICNLDIYFRLVLRSFIHLYMLKVLTCTSFVHGN